MVMNILSRVSVPLEERFQIRFAEAVRTQDRRSNSFSKVVKEAGETAVLTALRLLFPALSVEQMPEGNKGFDILLDGRIRVQVKASTMIDEVQGIFGNYDFDVAVIVDLGIAIRERPEKYNDRSSYPYSDSIGFFVLPRDVVIANVITNAGGKYIYGLKGQQLIQRTRRQFFRELPQWENRWDILVDML
jgi:hypothetical protein